MKKMFFSLIAVLSMLFLSGHAFAADIKLGTVDVQKVVQSTPQFGQILSDLKKQFGDREKKISDAQSALKQATEEYSRNSAVMTAGDRKTNEEKLVNQDRELRQMQAAFQKDFMEAQNKKGNELLEKVKKVVSDVAAKEKLSAVIIKSGVVYADNQVVDITQQVIEVLKK